MRPVLITGAAGRIGSKLVQATGDRYALRLTDRSSSDEIEVQECNLATDIDGLAALVDGIDTVVHLAGDPDPSATWESLLEANIVATYNVFAAAKKAGCRRVVFASSVHAVTGYPADRQARTDDAVNPGDLYGVTKCFGEALGRYLAEQEGLSVIAVRIGAFQAPEVARDPDKAPYLDLFVAEDDLCDLLVRCIDAPDDVRFAMVHGLSDNRFKRLDMTDTCSLLDYRPKYDFADVSPTLASALEGVPRPANLGDPAQKSGMA